MKHLTYLLILFTLLSTNSKAQLTLPKEAINDYANSAFYEYKYGNGNFMALIHHRLRSKGWSDINIAVGMESLGTNSTFRNATFEALFWRGSNRDYLFANLVSMGIKATNAEILTDYILTKFNAEIQRKNDEEQRAMQLKQKKDEQLAALRQIEEKKKEALRVVEEEKRRKELQTKTELLRSKIYDIASYDNEYYLSYRNAILNAIKAIIEKREVRTNSRIISTYQYSYEDSLGSVMNGKTEFSLVEGFKIPELVYFKYIDPKLFIDGILVPIRLKIDNIRINYIEGIAEVKINKGGKIKYLNSTPDVAIQNLIAESIDTKQTETNFITYKIGSLFDRPFEIIQQQVVAEKK